MAVLKLVSAVDTIDLSAMQGTEYGARALNGLTGFGLPDTAVQTSSGAGAGVKYRGARVLERTIDVPLHLWETSRVALQSLLSRFSMLLAEPSVLQFTDGAGAVWTLDVYRTGGGGYVYGDDTLGTDWLKTIITLQAGDPFWKRTTPQSVTILKPALGAVTLVNDGDAPTPAVWTFTGPGVLARLVSPSGEVMPWNGVVSPGEILTIDTAARTAKDNLGRNRYGEFGVAPRFPDLPGGTSAWTVEFDSTSAEYSASFPLNTYNFVKRPIVAGGVIAGWTVTDRLLWTSGVSSATVSNVGVEWLKFTVVGGGLQAERTATITGLTVGQEYRFGATAIWNKGSRGTTQPHLGPYIAVESRADRAGRDRYGLTTELRGSFVAAATTATLRIGAGTHKNWNSNSSSSLGRIFVTDDPASVHFDGNTADVVGGAQYSWEGAVDASRSIKGIPTTPSNATTQVGVTWFPRRWALI